MPPYKAIYDIPNGTEYKIGWYIQNTTKSGGTIR
jgi:hypothetical protein